jgi:hypothetical protein
MKPWLINIIAIAVVLFIGFFVPYGRNINIAIFIASAIWAYTDAKKIQYDKYKLIGFVPGGGPIGVAAIVFLFWIIGFPIYVSYRQKILDGKIPLKDAVVSTPTPPMPNQ